MDYTCYQDIIRDEFQQRMKGNPHYSLRSFAKKLEMSPSRLSEILNNKQGLSVKWAQKISVILGFDQKKTKLFKLLVESSHSKSPIKRNLALDELGKFKTENLRTVPLDHYALISDDRHYALLELMKTQNFKHSLGWMSEKMNLSEEEIKEAISRLKRLGMLKYSKGKYLVVDTNPFTTISPVPSEAIQEHHHKMIRKAQDSIHSQSYEERELNSLIFAIHENDIPEIRKEIREFFNKINTKYSDHDRVNNKVYALCSQFFNLIPNDLDH